jgi:hypothetical protein
VIWKSDSDRTIAYPSRGFGELQRLEQLLGYGILINHGHPCGSFLAGMKNNLVLFWQFQDLASKKPNEIDSTP